MVYGVIPTRPARMGDDVTSTDLTSSLTGSVLSGSTTSPFLYIGAGLLVWFLIMRGRDVAAKITGAPVRRRRSKRVSTFNAVLYAAGAGAGGYLLGKYTNL